MLGAWEEDDARLERAERHRPGRADRRAADGAVVPLHAGGDVHGHDGWDAAGQRLDGRAPFPVRLAPEPRPEDGVDGHIGAVELAAQPPGIEGAPPPSGLDEPGEARRGRASELGRIHQDGHRHPQAPAKEVAGGDEPVASVVPLAAHHDGSLAVRAPGHPNGGPGHRGPRVLHQRLHGDPAFGAPAVELGALLGGEDGSHPGS